MRFMQFAAGKPAFTRSRLSVRPLGGPSVLLRPLAAIVASGLLAWPGLAVVATHAVALESLDAASVESEWQREVAAREVAKAGKAVEQARAEATEAKAALDRFVAEHFNELRSHIADPLPEPVRRPLVTKPVPSPQAERLNHQISELTARRDELLEHLTAAHPEVVDVDGRIAEVSQRLKALGDAAEDVALGEPIASGNTAATPSATASLAERQRQEAAIRLYDEYLARWQSAEQELQEATAAEESAARRLAALSAPSPKTPAVTTPEAVAPGIAGPPSAGPIIPAPQRLSVEAERGSQPLAIAALLIALAVAALAAVKLARSSGEAMFSSVEDVAAALALPVVGVIPTAQAIGGAEDLASRARRSAIVAGQILLAIAIFALVAYCVQNPQSVWDACLHPLDSFGVADR
jgi:hypothetical protein